MLVSAKTGDNITILFNVLVNKYLDPSFQEQIEPIIQKNEDNIKIKKQPEKGKKKGGCC